VGDLLSDPVGTVVQGVTNIVTHPVDLLKDVVAWDTWAESPGRPTATIARRGPRRRSSRYQELGTDPTGQVPALVSFLWVPPAVPRSLRGRPSQVKGAIGVALRAGRGLPSTTRGTAEDPR
jgi:hypothetical protein